MVGGSRGGNRQLPENVGMRDVFGRETDRIIRILADAGLINEIVDKSTSFVIDIAGQLYITAQLFNDSDKALTNNAFKQVYIDRYYNELLVEGKQVLRL